MDEQRVERALRTGPPFATRYVARPLALAEWSPSARWNVRRVALLLALVALLLAVSLVAAYLAGQLRSSPVGAFLRQDVACSGVNSQCPDTLNLVYPDGREEAIFPPAGGTFDIPGFAWSPTGQQLVVDALSAPFGSGNAGLYLVGTDGSSVRLLRSWAKARDGCYFARWSPDGRQIACTSIEQGVEGNYEWATLQAIDVASGTSTTLARIPYWRETDFRWSPDSERLMYLAGYEGSDERLRQLESLWIVRRDGSNREQLIPPADMPPLSGPTQDIGDFRWSPASDAVAFWDRRRGRPMISVVRLDGGRSEFDPPLAPPNLDERYKYGWPKFRVLAWARPDEITYAAGDFGWLFVATTASDGTPGAVLLDWMGEPEVPWDSDARSVAWDSLWFSPDGRTMHWWAPGGSVRPAKRCLMAAERGDVRPRTESCWDNVLVPRMVRQD